jgi:hypothetical protein
MVWPATVGSYVAEGRCVERRTVSVFGLRRYLTVCSHESLDVSAVIMILCHPGDVGVGVGGLWIKSRWWSTGIGRYARWWAAHRSAR